MPDPLFVIVLFIAIGLPVLVVVGIRRMGGVRGGRGGVSSGVANWLADVNAMLQPQQPTAEVLRRAKEADEEREGEGDDEDPEAIDPARRA
ncbi:hypothetical protein [Paraliomyxa miuraensis]|uniref:hypothetical protein n=1 Tax=Paraliomyxa miuraensis TaxID=376150 RepID=UPI0022502126|nr:hypothetical protein [Paraliomyxa miuraensis]MCX4241112.1 hypothetical protein [Paraliomyxa miuraensis]